MSSKSPLDMEPNRRHIYVCMHVEVFVQFYLVSEEGKSHELRSRNARGKKEQSMRRVLILVHCQEGYRHRRIDQEFIDTLAQGIRARDFDEIIHLSASAILYHDDLKHTVIFHEIKETINRVVMWDFCEFDPRQQDGHITDKEVDAIFDGIYSYKEAGLERMDRSHWNIPLAHRRFVISHYPSSVFWKEDRYSRQFAWIPDEFRNPDEWIDCQVVVGGLFRTKCVQDFAQILGWMGIEHYLDPVLTSDGI